MKISVYEPQSITLPKEAPIHRTFPNEVDRIDNTIFYDIFYSHDNSTIICIGPPLRNLKGVLELQEISCNGKQLRYSRPKLLKRNDLCNLVVIKVPRLLRRESTVQLSFHFNLFEKAVEISQNHPLARENGKCPLTLVTLQKDNPLQWIRDWIRWHNRMHGVGKLILYDNGSREYGYDELVDALHGEGEDFQSLLVNWDFPYGQPIGGWGNNGGIWAQEAALNHCYLKYGHRGWLLNLDIDEYLVAEDATSLQDYVRETSRHYLPFRQREVQGIGSQKPLAERSFRDFLWYQQEEKVDFQNFLSHPKYPEAWKYACQCNMPLWLSTHLIVYKGLNTLRFQVKLYSIIIRHMGLIKLFSKIMPDNNPPREIFRVYHFLLLSTGWKTPIDPNHPKFQHCLRRKTYRDKAYFEAQSVEIIYDDTMIKQAQKHGL